MKELEIKKLRRQYKGKPLSEKSVDKNPFKQFEIWFNEQLKADFIEPSAMVLSTASKSAKPSSRVLLLKGFDENGFIFFTNYESKKGKDLKENPFASMLFYWDKLNRQVRIEGKVEKISAQESEAYFQTRPYKSKIGAWASKQSYVIDSRAVIVKNFLKYLVKFKTNVPIPYYWGGYRLIPNLFEFWQGRPNRLHDRIRYSLIKNNWIIERLAP